MEKNQIIKLEITDLSYDALGVAHTEDGITVFVNNALPGEVVEAQILKVKKNLAFARVQNILVKSPERIEVKKNQWVQTGLASLAHLSYDAQLKFKQQQVENLLQKAHLTDVTVKETLPSPQITGYRNKAEVPVRQINGKLEIGFFRKHSHDMVPLENFFTTDAKIDQILVATRDILRKNHVSAYNEKSHLGAIKYLMVRVGHYTGEIMVVLVSTVKNFPQLPQVISEIEQLPNVKSVVLNYNPQKTNVILGRKDILLAGNPYITDQIGEQKFMISPQSFFQINSEQTTRLYDLAVRQADLQADDVVIDAYSGIGTIGLSVAQHVKKVIGVEVVKSAVEDSENNAALNQIDNADFALGKAEEMMPKWQEQGLSTDVVFVDPPRKGLTPEFIEATVKTGPKKVVYISCNPATLVRDLQQFQELGYKFDTIAPVDMFPMTPHVETVVLMSRVDK
ncbi:RNA methyltransferase [Amylolactobacillus amylotrophicus DSM 20534]|uniref:RNA methyltransferase n=3 Tax=Amylolactobacillus TaxID=2767876 RepID=A0A0R1YHZ9_9LACO|nr:MULTISPECIES: 23S rRNA (uracil(1939)-C(5))-methyltransferase RlmD [Amylolactobacillus]APT18868.1 23S rRNA (uracil-5-)-methyltransferase RumA [Amylolactobacillus amylophilus DSM 20533 = JCM 1125]KRK36926.1 RNA methyltransferase [Amylolactobacillus amylotrophicus DSM 20534]KRM41938.1 RNA methyltransferase [Amylolactobacillus amylophilus DSM 20533 = JCM 1125]GED80950.1 23S rRNA (uracil-5-)-methyltransferase RumA [Amylolactobacillus amylophilus]